MTSFPTNSFRRLLAGGLAGGAALTLAACGAVGPSGSSTGGSNTGGSSTGASSASASSTAAPTGTQISTAVKTVTSVHISGTVDENNAPVTLNMGLLSNGDMSGTITTGKTTVTIISVNNASYILVTPAFLKSAIGPAAGCDGLCGKYVKVSGGQQASLTQGIDLTSMTKAFTTLRGVAAAGTTTFDGQKVFIYKDPQDSATVYVAATGPAYPLRIVGKDLGTTATLVFSDWNQVPVPVAPPASEQVNQAGL